MTNTNTKPAAETLSYEALRLVQIAAEKSGNSSALFCAREAEARFNEGRDALCAKWALESAAHSVGVFAPLYAQIQDLYDRI